MEDDDDNESILSVNRCGENIAVASKVAILKNSKEPGSSSRRDRRRNRRYENFNCALHYLYGN